MLTRVAVAALAVGGLAWARPQFVAEDDDMGGTGYGYVLLQMPFPHSQEAHAGVQLPPARSQGVHREDKSHEHLFIPVDRAEAQQPQLFEPRELIDQAVEGGFVTGLRGVVCPTWLHRDIQKQNLAVYLTSAGYDSDAFKSETKRLCGGSAGPSAASYTGIWNENNATVNDTRVFKGLAAWAHAQRAANKSQNLTWQQFSKPDNGASAARLIRKVAEEPEALSHIGPWRMLDFGCGSGADIVAAAKEFKATVNDTLCADIFKVDRDDVTPIVLDASSDDAYKGSLEAALEQHAGTVDIAISIVTFHHVTRTQRHAAFSFLNRVLVEDGVLIFADWDNSVHPNRWIHFDLVHFLPGILMEPSYTPESPERFNLGTEYLSVADWVKAASAAGLAYDAPRSLLGGHLGPEAQANRSNVPNRDFIVIFRRH